MTKPTLYLDMDGVLADFNLAAERVLRATEEDHQAAAQRGRWPREQWELLKQQPRFYRHLPKTGMADQLVALARRFRDDRNWNIGILTAIPKDNDVPESFQDKMEWVQEYYPDLRVYFGPYSRDKAQHCRTPQDILVDDRRDNCEGWQQAGGRAVAVSRGNHDAVLVELESILSSTGKYSADV